MKDLPVKIADVLSADAFLRTLRSNHSATAPEKIRANVKLAASMSFCFSAARQSSELLAKAIIVSDVITRILVDFITDEILR
jgi:hypothetical protein